MRITTYSMAALFAALLAVPANAECTRMGFSVNDYGKDGPTRDAKDLLDKHIAKKMTERGVKTYRTGKKDVKCELFLNFIVFDEHTCTAEATVCWNGTALPKGEQDTAEVKTGEKTDGKADAKTAAKSKPAADAAKDADKATAKADKVKPDVKSEAKQDAAKADGAEAKVSATAKAKDTSTATTGSITKPGKDLPAKFEKYEKIEGATQPEGNAKAGN